MSSRWSENAPRITECKQTVKHPIRKNSGPIWRRTLLLVLAVVGPFLLTGCYALAAGIVVGIVALSDDGGGGGGSDQPPIVLVTETPDFVETPDEVQVGFAVVNGDDGGLLSAQIEYVVVGKVGDSDLRFEGLQTVPAELRTPATHSQDSASLENLESLKPVSFKWNAGDDLGGDSAMVRVIITPFEDGSAGRAFLTEPFRAGNTPVEIDLEGLTLASTEDLLVAQFRLFDAEADRIRLERFEIALEGIDFKSPQFYVESVSFDEGDFFCLPLREDLGKLLVDPEDFPSKSPEEDGEVAGLRFSLSSLAGLTAEELFLCANEVAQEQRPKLLEAVREAAEKGFIGALKLRISLRDFVTEELEVIEFPAEAPFLFDNNDPPSVEIVSVGATEPTSGVIPIRYRLFDDEFNLSNLVVEFDLDDEQGFRVANEFPAPPSEGRRNLCTLDPSGLNDPGSCAELRQIHTFLWDAGSQTHDRHENVTVRISPRDREPAPGNSRTFGPLSVSALESLGEIDAGRLPLALVSDDFDKDGFSDVVVAKELSGKVTYLRGSGGGLVREGEIDAGRLPIALVSGDFDGDGFPDVVVANSLSDNVTYLRGGAGGLERVGEIEAGDLPRALVSGDFDGDGFIDVVVANALSDNVSYLRGGAGGLERQDDSEIEAGPGPSALVSGDFDGDGFPDVVVANSDSDNVSYLRGGAGGLERADDSEIEAGFGPSALVSGDFDEDGFTDVVVANEGSANVTYLRGGAGGLERVGEIEAGAAPRALVSGDFDGEGFPDVVVANAGSDNVTYLRGSVGGLERVGQIEVGHFPSALVSEDFDEDGFADVVVANANSANVTYLRGGAGGLERVGEIEVGEAVEDPPPALVSGDFDGDGFGDVLVANFISNNVTYLRGSAGGLERVDVIRAGDLPGALVSGDFDGDGFSDVVVANEHSDNVTYLRGGAGGLQRVGEIEAGAAPRALVSGDFNGDGFPDVVVANSDSDNVNYLRGGPGGLERVDEIRARDRPSALVSGDFDEDGFADVVVANEFSDNVTYLSGGAGGLERVGEIDAGEGPQALVSGDFDGDGFTDVVVANSDSDNVSYLRGGAGGLEREDDSEIEAGLGPSALVSGDFNGDGFFDVVVANSDSDNVSYLRGGAGGLERADDSEIEAGLGPGALVSGDFNGDGFPDVVVAKAGSRNVTYLRGGAGGLVRVGEVEAGEGRPTALVSGDFDGDGFLDVVVGNQNLSTVTYLRGGVAGLERVGEIEAGDVPSPLVSGDFDGDGFADVLVSNTSSDKVTYLRQRFLLGHANYLFDSGNPSAFQTLIREPRNPARFQLELPEEPFTAPTQVCLVPGPVFELPQAEAFGRGRFLVNVTVPVTLLRELTEIQGEAWLTLRLRDVDPALLDEVMRHPENLRVFRKDSETSVGVDQQVTTELVEFDTARSDNPAVRFLITRFGSYVVALERER